MKQKTDLHQSLSALTTAEFDANPPTAIRPLTPPVECAECERLRVENEALRLALMPFARAYQNAGIDGTNHDKWYQALDYINGNDLARASMIIGALENE